MVEGRRGEAVAFSSDLPLREKGANTLNLSHSIPPRSPGNAICCKPHPFGAKEIVVERPEALARVVATISAAHQVLDHQADVNQADPVVWGQVPLSGKNNTHRQIQKTA